MSNVFPNPVPIDAPVIGRVAPLVDLVYLKNRSIELNHQDFAVRRFRPGLPDARDAIPNSDISHPTRVRRVMTSAGRLAGSALPSGIPAWIDITSVSQVSRKRPDTRRSPDQMASRIATSQTTSVRVEAASGAEGSETNVTSRYRAALDGNTFQLNVIRWSGPISRINVRDEEVAPDCHLSDRTVP